MTRKYQKWTQANDEQLERIAGGMSKSDIAEVMQRPLASVMSRAQKLGISLAFEKPTPREWSKENSEQLERLVVLGKTLKQIATITGRTHHAIRCECSRRGLFRFKGKEEV